MDQIVKFQFARAPGVTISAVNGYWGYATGTGRVLVDLYYQHPIRAEAVAYQMDASGKLGKEVERAVSATVLREILASVELMPELAAELGQYLIDAAKNLGWRPGELTATAAGG